jgi:Cytochrome c oxidase subunit IV
VNDLEPESPPAGEEIHLPGPSILPFVTAIGLTMTVIGTTIAWWITIVGAIIFLIAVVGWIRDTRRDIDALPEEHH